MGGSIGGQPDNKNAEKWDEDEALQLGNNILSWIREKGGARIFLSQYLYIENDYPANIISSLSKKFDSFSELIKKAKKIQETKLRLGGLGKANTAMAVFCLKNNHGYKDRQDITTDNEKLDVSPPSSITEGDLIARIDRLSTRSKKAKNCASKQNN